MVCKNYTRFEHFLCMLLRMDLSAWVLGFDDKDFGEDFVVVSALRDSHTLRYCDCTVHNVLVFEDDI